MLAILDTRKEHLIKDVDKLLARINILVVDDMEAIRGMIKATLLDLGAARVDMAVNGEDAWKKAKHKHYHLIISDWDMPKMTGIEFLLKIRASDEHKHILFLLLTASTEKERVMAAVKSGVSDYLSKPFQSNQLHLRVLKLLPRVKLD